MLFMVLIGGTLAAAPSGGGISVMFSVLRFTDVT